MLEESEFKGRSICPTCKHSMVMRIRVSSPEPVMTVVNGRPVQTGQVIKQRTAYQFACHRFSGCVWQNPGVDVTSCTEWEASVEHKVLKSPEEKSAHTGSEEAPRIVLPSDSSLA